MKDSIPVNLPQIGAIGVAEGFGDVTAHFNARDWLERAIVSKGAKVTGKGMGMGQADISFTLDGCAFSVSIRPIVSRTNATTGQ